MRLTKEQVQVISSLIFENLKKKELVIFKTEEAVIMKRILLKFLGWELPAYILLKIPGRTMR